MEDRFDILRSLLMADRTVRRFDESHIIDPSTLLELVELTRFCASGRNAQPLRYRLVTTDDERAAVFPALKWAGYFTDWDGPAEGERPAAYIVQCLDLEYGSQCLCDDGLELQAITLGATAKGLGGCIIKSFNKATVKEALGIPDRYDPRYVLALGIPAETVVIEEMPADDDFRYWRDAGSVHHVPKRSLTDRIITHNPPHLP